MARTKTDATSAIGWRQKTLSMKAKAILDDKKKDDKKKDDKKKPAKKGKKKKAADNSSEDTTQIKIDHESVSESAPESQKSVKALESPSLLGFSLHSRASPYEPRGAQPARQAAAPPTLGEYKRRHLRIRIPDAFTFCIRQLQRRYIAPLWLSSQRQCMRCSADDTPILLTRRPLATPPRTLFLPRRNETGTNENRKRRRGSINRLPGHQAKGTLVPKLILRNRTLATFTYHRAFPMTPHTRAMVQQFVFVGVEAQIRRAKSSNDESDPDAPGSSKLRVTLGGKNGSKGMFVDEVIDLSEAPERWLWDQLERPLFMLIKHKIAPWWKASPGVVWNEFENEQSRETQDRHIHAVTMQTDMHVIITVNPELAALVHDASWIMVDMTFAVVHGTTNEWKLLIWLNGLDKRTVIGRVWSNRATRETFVLVWNGIFEAIEKITGKAINFKVFSKASSLLGAIGDSEGVQAQGLDDVIILRGMDSSAVNGIPTVTVNGILVFIWKTCIVHFKRGVFALEAHVDDFVFNCLLGFPYLDSLEEIATYRWWAHKISYPWLLPSLNRRFTSMSKLHWDLTPGDTNPIEGSHVQDNQVNATNRTLIEAILLARDYDKNTARVIMASLTSGIMENGNNSLQARFAAVARRQSRTKAKSTEKANVDGGKMLKAKLRASERQSNDKDTEIQRLKTQLAAFADAGPSTPTRRAQPSHRYISIDSPEDLSPVAGPSRLPELNLFPDLPPMTPIAEPRSDFDYQLALRSDILDVALNRIAYDNSNPVDFDSQDHPLYSVGDSEDEILVSDPYLQL
ncbi:hypothetical protein C8J57DRAFT_1234525 [Mycena rebaudengoi]|nr:hypothetical protein C8J57DRAFT_1234525 [Mycena rebaudengoi]